MVVNFAVVSSRIIIRKLMKSLLVESVVGLSTDRKTRSDENFYSISICCRLGKKTYDHITFFVF